ncbi:MAG: hypothetical protein M3P49_08105 [Actinomycetota bacterium]|nr:hypothetical protein [Actinomycetota bacterium]
MGLGVKGAPGGESDTAAMNTTLRTGRRSSWRIPALAAAGVLAWLFVLFYFFLGPAAAPPKANVMESIHAFDTTDPRKLVGYSDAVFVGEVVRKVGSDPIRSSIPGDTQPRSQYEVRVEDPIKAGGLDKGATVVVNQKGGEDQKTGEDWVVVGVVNDRHYRDEMLLEGRSYLFSVRYNEREDRYDLSVQPQGKAPLDGASQKERENLVAAFERAETRQVDPMSAAEGDGGG